MKLLLSLAAALLAGAATQAQRPSTPPFVAVPSTVDSGYLTNSGPAARVVFRQPIRLAATAWLQLHLGEGVSLPEGSFLRLTSTLDGGVQRHDGRSVADWAGWSAAFNGDEVMLELVAGPNSVGNRVVVAEVIRGLPIVGTDSLCGVDNRALSSDPRQGRMFIGCTGWLISQDLMLTAGHCTASGTPVVEFNVPLSTSSGSIVRSHPNDQYPFTTLNRLDAGIGSDWSVCRVGRNSNTGQLPTQANGGQWYNLGAVPPSTSGQNIRITGYGSTSSPVSPTWYLVQKTHVGPLAQIAATSLCYATDTTGGNSGSPVIHENTGAAIGIHTHSGCTSTGGCNNGTRIDRTDLQSAIRAAGRTPGDFATIGAGCAGTGQLPNSCASVNPNGGSLTGSTATNEYAYAGATVLALNVTGFRVYSRSSTGSPVTVAAAIYGDQGGQPTAAPLAQTTVTIGTSAGFHLASFASPVAIPAGRFYVSVDHSAGTTYLANLASGSSGQAFWRRPAFSGTWALSGLVTAPSFLVECQGGGGAGATPILAGAGTPETGQQYGASLAFARPSAPCSVLSGFSSTSWAGGALPFALTGFGAPGCSLLIDPAITASAMTDGQGAATYSVSVPNNPALVGFRIFHQWFVLDAGANQLGLAVSNGLRVTVGG